MATKLNESFGSFGIKKTEAKVKYTTVAKLCAIIRISSFVMNSSFLYTYVHKIETLKSPYSYNKNFGRT
jgi:hypothetical protein